MRWLLVLVCLFFINCPGCGRGISDGDRTGYVVKMTRKGFWWKSWEGSLQVSGSGAGVVGTWDFSVSDDHLVLHLQKAQQGGTRVTLHYLEWWWKSAWVDSPYEVTGVSQVISSTVSGR